MNVRNNCDPNCDGSVQDIIQGVCLGVKGHMPAPLGEEKNYDIFSSRGVILMSVAVTQTRG